MFFFFFFKQKTAYEMRISDWSSDVCSSDLGGCDRSGGSGPGHTLSAARPGPCAAPAGERTGERGADPPQGRGGARVPALSAVRGDRTGQDRGLFRSDRRGRGEGRAGERKSGGYGKDGEGRVDRVGGLTLKKKNNQQT